MRCRAGCGDVESFTAAVELSASVRDGRREKKGVLISDACLPLSLKRSDDFFEGGFCRSMRCVASRFSLSEEYSLQQVLVVCTVQYF